MAKHASLLENKSVPHFQDMPSVTIGFEDLTYSVPQGRKGAKVLLRGLNGVFQAGKLNAILGPSGAGKTTLLNVLAGLNSSASNHITGSIKINGQERNMKEFRKMARYIMQEDLVQPLLTVQESMMVSADLKLNNVSKNDKLAMIANVLDMLRLKKTKDTTSERLSGGERKRLSIALELVGNPPVIFLDEPTSGLDDLSCTQCVSVLKMLAQDGRTIICSIHTPGAKLFAMFDNVYIVSAGLCVYQGMGQSLVPFLSSIGIDCPKHYTPVDFMIDVASGEYGDQTDLLVSAIENGKNRHYCTDTYDTVELNNSSKDVTRRSESVYAPTTVGTKPLSYKPERVSNFRQFQVLCNRFWLQTFRDTNHLILKFGLYLFLGVFIGNFYLKIGVDASLAIYNFGFCYVTLIVFMYMPLLPILLKFPTEIRLLKREYFNQWYNLGPYYCAITCSTLPLQAVLGFLYVTTTYFLTSQPLEFYRMVMFFVICTLTAFTAESFGMMISSVMNILNSLFVGPVVSVPMMLLAVYGIGTGPGGNIPILIRIGMSCSYLRYSIEALMSVIYGFNRENLPCPDEEIFCPFASGQFLQKFMGMDNIVLWVDMVALTVFFLLYRVAAFYLLRQRLRPSKTFRAIKLLAALVKSRFAISK